MKGYLIAIILAVMALTAGPAVAQSPPGTNAPAAAANIRVLAPQAGQKLQQTFVTVQYELTNAGIAGGAPNFSVQLDSRDPVTTTQTQQNFTGLGPGVHTVIVQLVDANNTPIAASRAEVQFTIVAPSPQPKTVPGGGSAAEGAQPQSDAAAANMPAYEANEALPSSGSALPLLSVIGFGALVGGIVSAMRTR